jgi:hypothetical protein
MGGAVSGITDSIGITNYGEQQDKAKQQEARDKDLANQEKEKLDMQQKAVEGEKKAQQQELNAKKKRLAYQQGGASGLINFNPESQATSILG